MEIVLECSTRGASLAGGGRLSFSLRPLVKQCIPPYPPSSHPPTPTLYLKSKIPLSAPPSSSPRVAADRLSCSAPPNPRCNPLLAVSTLLSCLVCSERCSCCHPRDLRLPYVLRPTFALLALVLTPILPAEAEICKTAQLVLVQGAVLTFYSLLQPSSSTSSSVSCRLLSDVAEPLAQLRLPTSTHSTASYSPIPNPPPFDPPLAPGSASAENVGN